MAAIFTGLGGGMIRDLLARRNPIALKEEIHAVLAMLCGVCIWLGFTDPIQLTLIVFSIVTIRMLAIRFKWRLHLPCSLKKSTKFKAACRRKRCRPNLSLFRFLGSVQ
ncbi:TRIC cation channel family protein [Paenibacillus sp. CC-CFT747]|nr:TRIC cation channel family protein [Paenibacillus sp. CC-CFT747]